MEIGGGFAALEQNRRVEGGMSQRQGVEEDAAQKNLQKAQQDQIKTIRELIKLEEQELKILESKNKLEKDSVESLLAGDIEKFMKDQAAVGATAAIATGNQGLMNMFGPEALGDAYKDISRQQKEGVQSLYGVQIGGPGGLGEQAAGAGLRARGIQDPRMAQLMAGTTAEEEAKKSRIRDLGGMLGETGDLGSAMAGMQVTTANMNIAQATLKVTQLNVDLDELADAGLTPAQAQRNAMGGLIYASNGVFVPRGTDTVPAMLTPGEFVVRRSAVKRGNNLQMLRAMNSGSSSGGYSSGGSVGYYAGGGEVTAASISNIGEFRTAFDKFNSDLSRNIENLANMKIQIKLDTTNVNVNLNGTSFLSALKEDLRKELLTEVGEGIKGLKFDDSGNASMPQTVL